MSGELDEVDIEDLKRESHAQRRLERAHCGECGCTGGHFTGCPEAPDNEEGEE